MLSVRAFRTLLVAAVAVGVLGGATDLVLPSLLAESFRQAQQSHDAALSTTRVLVLGTLGIAALVVTILAVYGLYALRRWGLGAAAIATVLSLSLLLFSGSYAQSGPAIALSYLASYLWGAVLLAAATQPLNAYFRRNDG